MRQKLFLALALLATAGAIFTSAPRAEAATCNWECGVCGLICPCERCVGGRPFCVCNQ